jgi:hypothetical protein
MAPRLLTPLVSTSMVLTSASVFTTTSNSKTLVYINQKKDGCPDKGAAICFIYINYGSTILIILRIFAPPIVFREKT